MPFRVYHCFWIFFIQLIWLQQPLEIPFIFEIFKYIIHQISLLQDCERLEEIFCYWSSSDIIYKKVIFCYTQSSIHNTRVRSDKVRKVGKLYSHCWTNKNIDTLKLYCSQTKPDSWVATAWLHYSHMPLAHCFKCHLWGTHLSKVTAHFVQIVIYLKTT